MSETMHTAHAWRLDVVGSCAGSRKTAARATAAPGEDSTKAGMRPSKMRFAPARFIIRWKEVMRTWTKARFRGLMTRSVRFEEILSEFTCVIETAGDAVVVEEALLRQARRMVPRCRIELISSSARPRDEGEHKTGTDADDGVRNPVFARADQGSRSPLELPLRCGGASHGWLRIRSRTRPMASLRRETVRRLSTLCTVAACALERLHLHAGWPEDEDAPGGIGPEGAGANCDGASPEARSGTITGLHDATFLNAVLPFALSQARRHHEPLSILCVAIDRLAGIQELLGSGTVDRLVRSVAGTVASLIRASDIIARLDDDRVIAVLPRAPGGGALHVAEKICRAVEVRDPGECATPRVTVSIGVATFPAAADNVFALFDAADEALTRAQSLGRNQACLAPRRGPVAAVKPQVVSSRW